MRFSIRFGGGFRCRLDIINTLILFSTQGLIFNLLIYIELLVFLYFRYSLCSKSHYRYNIRWVLYLTL